MTELLTSAQMRSLEQAAIESGEVTGLELMERAGRGVVEAIFEEWPELKQTSHRAVVLCGPGNNGGDGFVVARLLKEWGWEVEVFLYGDPEKLPPDARVNYERWTALGDVAPLTQGALKAAVDRDFQKSDYGSDDYASPEVNRGQTTIYVDALFGTGLTRGFDADLLQISSEWEEHCYKFGVAVDMPSGLCSDSGRCLGNNWFYSRLLVTFEAAKVGQFLSANNYDIDRVKVVPLNISWPYRSTRDSILLIEEAEIEFDHRGFFENGLNKSQRSHKYSHGHALILSGGPGKGGAARLAARGALRIGAGLVTVGCPPAALQENAAALTAIMLKSVHDADALVRILEDGRINALCLGPGLGTGEREAALVAAALESRGGPRPTPDVGRGLPRLALVLDADALTLIGRHHDLFAALHKHCVLTPHAGEFARLFPDIAEKLNAPATKGPAYSKVDATREAAARAGCIVLFKGPDTVIADPTGRAAINSAHYDRAAPWLATAGSGDVLAGMIAGLLARGFAPMQAAETAAWLHVECALSFGPGLIAEDIPEELPKVFRSLGV